MHSGLVPTDTPASLCFLHLWLIKEMWFSYALIASYKNAQECKLIERAIAIIDANDTIAYDYDITVIHFFKFEVWLSWGIIIVTAKLEIFDYLEKNRNMNMQTFKASSIVKVNCSLLKNTPPLVWTEGPSTDKKNDEEETSFMHTESWSIVSRISTCAKPHVPASRLEFSTFAFWVYCIFFVLR